MIFPIGDWPNPPGHRPWLTWLLISINFAVWIFFGLPLSETRPDLASPLVGEYLTSISPALGSQAQVAALTHQLTDWDLFVFRWGFRPDAPALRTLLSSMFLHAGLAHLAGNMLFLWIYGNNIEHRLGRPGVLAAYLGGGVVATLFHWFSASSSPVPMVGASGAISGILGFYFVLFPRNQVRMLWLLPPFFLQQFLVPARLVLGLYLVIENVLPWLFTSSDVGVAHGAHIGGFVAGWFVARFCLRGDHDLLVHDGM